MTTQAVEVNFYTRSGKTLTLFNADVDDSDTDGEEILSGGNGLNVPTGTSLGQYGQGETITHGLAIASDTICYAYIENAAGTIIAALPIASDSTVTRGMEALCSPIQLQTGMKCVVRTVATSSAVVSYSAVCASGKVAIFTATASNGAAVNFASVKSGLDIGRVLDGQTITKCYTSTQVQLNTGESSGSSFIQVLSNTGETKAMYAQQSCQITQPYFQMMNVRIHQNDTSQVYYDSS